MTDRDQKTKNLKDAYKIIFKSKEGEVVLNDLADKCYFIKRLFDENAATMYFREGRRDLYLYILNLLED